MDTSRNFGAGCGLLCLPSLPRYWQDMVEAVGSQCQALGEPKGHWRLLQLYLHPQCLGSTSTTSLWLLEAQLPAKIIAGGWQLLLEM